MKRSITAILFAFTLAFTFSSCKLEPVVPEGVQDVKFNKLDMLKGEVEMEMGLKINNPNSFNVCIYNVDMDVSVAGVSLGKVAMTDKLKMKKNQEAVYPVKVHAQLKDLLTNLPKLVAAIKGKQSNVSCTGSIKVGSGILRHTFPININQDKVSTSGN